MIAAVCLFRAAPLADSLFAEDEAGFLTGLSRRDALTVGLALLGVSTALAGLPGLLQFAGKALWYAERSRQSMFAPTMERSWDALINDALLILVGGALAAGAGRLASLLDSRETA